MDREEIIKNAVEKSEFFGRLDEAVVYLENAKKTRGKYFCKFQWKQTLCFAR